MQNKKITLRYLYRHAGKVAKEAQKGVSFDVYSRGNLSFKITPAKRIALKQDSKLDILKKMKGLHKGEVKHKQLSDNEILYG